MTTQHHLQHHLQPVIHYFNRGSSEQTPTLSKPASHLQPAVEYWNQTTSSRPVAPQRPQESSTQENEQPARPLAWLKSLWQSMMTVNLDPQIEQRQNRYGEPYWQVYDPTTGRHHTFAEQEDVYEWLERRYYE